ncbi:small acidic protein family-domain-containing protein [Corynascus novoguineensis]|uniref:Small acidic protein n=1 Tax=Corynascus novoguineensis TaxID=1126955 RepID=A0AAN7CYT4_9PEZI|nr:small acidic protein family-domain-containing protein [Corynascus novoguineensis]
MGEKSKKKSKEHEEDATTAPTAADTSIKDKKKKLKKSRGDKPASPEPEASEVPKTQEELKANGKKSKSEKEKTKDGKRKRVIADEIVDTGTAINVEDSGVTEPAKKKKKDEVKLDCEKSEKKDKKKKKKNKKNKKSKDGERVKMDGDHTQAEKDTAGSAKDEGTEDNGVKKIKEKGSKKTIKPQSENSVDDEQMSEKNEKKKKRKHKDQDADVNMVDVSAEDTKARGKEESVEGKKNKDKKAKKGKSEKDKSEKDKSEKDKSKKEKSKKEKSKKREATGASREPAEKETPASATINAPAADLAERWNVSGLGGGELRQSKFMRLLGGKKAGVAAPGTSEAKDGSRKKFDIGQVSQELEKQFDAGIQMKFGSGGQRKGLGA